MSCQYCGCQDYSCNCTSTTCETTCEDPGSIASGNYSAVYDQNTCPKRLQSPAANSVLVATQNGSGGFSVAWSSSPCVSPTELEITDGLAFNGLLASMGDAGCWRRLNPADAATGWLKADNGNWILAALPTTNVPDPLELENLTVTETANFNDIVIGTGGSLCFPGVPSGTITTTVGLNSDGCLVKQTSGSTPLGISMAEFYENASETSTETPNASLQNGQNPQIGNELYDPDNIAQVNSTTSIKILTAGKYSVRWMGSFQSPTSTRDVNLNLYVNGVLVARGCGPVRTADATVRTGMVFGEYLQSLSANDLITLVIESTESSADKVQRVKVILTRWGS